ncbi:DUF4435 domain-containing protein [Pseudomonas sp. ANT_J28]|uniref:DUF4435 domain-containing protein n=1 Tax=Pseudomonas sp. ANT_J28 TaxID=2597352 RepID=UPI0011F35AB8|nr:DUF4435 domain-containing protein [Pseudomonas sp. ANT_J28]KAA0983774.1 DUF4435 domain-containing protein [Pseudomonas sp. ANT_J28]
MESDNQAYGFKFKSSWVDKKKNFNSDGSQRNTVLVWVEADDDKKFWMNFLKDNPRYLFSYKQPDEATASDDKAANGCNRILSLVRNGDITPSKLQIVCIDSDDCFIKGFVDGYVSAKPANDFMYYTNIYSIENAMLDPEHIDRTFEVVSSEPRRNLFVSPSSFLEQISSCLFACYHKLNFFDVISQDRGLVDSVRARFYSTLCSLTALDLTSEYTSSQCYSDFCVVLDSLVALIDAEILRLNMQTEYTAYQNKLSSANIGPKNIYLFVKGHKILNLIVAVFEKISSKYKAAALKRARATYANPKSEVNRINNNWHDYKSLIFGAFCISDIHVDFFSDTRLKLAEVYA